VELGAVVVRGVEGWAELVRATVGCGVDVTGTEAVHTGAVDVTKTKGEEKMSWLRPLSTVPAKPPLSGRVGCKYVGTACGLAPVVANRLPPLNER
jgi:hypothetical protein